MAKRETVAQAHVRGYNEGYAAGVKVAREDFHRKYESKVGQMELLKAVTTVLQHTGQALGALSNVFDNGPRS